MSIRLLAFHAPYRCKHRGVCCTEPWAIPVERVRHRRILSAVESGAVRLAHTSGALFEAAPGVETDADVAVGRRGRSCVFYEPRSGGSCAIHRDIGDDAMPVACQHFPRVIVLDPRGMSLSLSCVCPTAADLLYDAGPGWQRVVHAGAVVLPGMEWAGLDARDTLPPQVSDALLWDWDAMTAFEAEALNALASLTPERALALIDSVAARLESAAAGELGSRVRSGFRDPGGPAAGLEVDLDALVTLAIASSMGAPAEPWTIGPGSAASAAVWQSHRGQVSRYLAARLMASSVLYHAHSARVWSGWLQTAYAVLRRSVEAEMASGHETARQLFTAALARSDRLLVHGIDPARLAASLHARSALPS